MKKKKKKPFHGYIYLIVCCLNDKEYVGQTTQTLDARFKQHAKSNFLIGKAIRAYGPENFLVFVLKECKSKAEMNKWERRFIFAKGCKSPFGYNLKDGGSNGQHSPETCQKMSESRRGENNPNYHKECSPETRRKIGEANTGKVRTDEVRQKLSELNKGENNPNFGYTLSEKERADMGAAHRKESIYPNLEYELKAQHISYAAGGKLLNVNPSTFSAKMLGKLRFTDAQKKILSAHLGKPIEYLFYSPTPLPEKTELERALESSESQRKYSPYKNLLAEMKAHGFTDGLLAKLMGMSRPSLSRKLSGKFPFTDRDKAKLVEIFGKPIEYLLAREDAE